MKKGYWVIRTYACGRVGEKTKYWVPGDRDTTVRGKRRERAEIKKQEQNEYSALKALSRILNANLTGGDILLGLDYSDEGIEKLLAWCRGQGMNVDGMGEEERADAIREAARHSLVLCMRRVSRFLAKDGIELRCFAAITSDMDGETGEARRIHHHLVIPGEVKDAFLAKWREGGVHFKMINPDQEDYTPIAEYLLRQVRKVPDEKKYITTRNIIRPQPKDRVAVSDAILRAPKDAKLLFQSEYKRGCPQYIRYVRAAERDRPRAIPSDTEVDNE